MRTIQEILNELSEHPDFVYCEIWTLKDVMLRVVENWLMNYKIDGDAEAITIDILDFISSEDKREIKQEWSDFLESIYNSTISNTDMDIIDFCDMPFYKSWIRNKNLEELFN